MGFGIVRDLIWEGSKGVDKVIVADRDFAKAKDLVTQLKDDRLAAEFIDVAKRNETVRLLKTVDVCINNIPTLAGLQMEIFEAALEAGKAYLDLGGLGIVTQQQKKLHEKFLAKGIAALLGMGSAPGISNILAKNCTEQLDTVEKVSIYWAGKYKGPERTVFVPPYNIQSLLNEYTEQNVQYIDGKAKKMPALSGEQFIDLPEPFGRLKFVHTTHSETATIPYSEGFKTKGIREVTWRLSMPEWCDSVMKALVNCGFGDSEPLKVDGAKIVPWKFLQMLLDRNVAKIKDQITADSSEGTEDHGIYFVIASGARGGHTTQVTTICYQPPDKFYEGYIDAATSMGASIGGQILGRGEMPPGVWAPEECIEVGKFFDELKKRHFEISMKIEKGL